MPWNRPARRARLSLVLTAFCLVGVVASVRPADGPALRAQIGLASYYGPGLHGERTASGETFDQNKLVAAHRTLPFGTLVRVTNLENGRTVRVRIVDRGPFVKRRHQTRIIDVSVGAARQLRFLSAGVVPVRVEVVKLPRGYDPSR